MRIKASGIRALAVAVTMALGVVAGLAFARPAYATPTLFENGGVYKFKTTWGGGFVLNTGAENGSMASGENAQVHWNRNWDNNNRWGASSEWLEFGHRWYMFRNRWAPKLCLYAPPGGNDVEQRPCDVNRDEFYWAFDAVAWGSDAGQIKNLAYYRQSSGYSLSQDSAQLFSRVHMAFGNFWATQFWTTKRCAGSGLPELKSC